MGTRKDRNGMDLTEAADIKNGQKYKEELYEKALHSQIIMMVTHLEPDFLECEDKWVLGRITRNKASGGDGITVDPLKILK